MPDAADWEARLASIAATREVEVFGFSVLRGGDVEYGLRRGEAFGEFLVSTTSMIGTLSVGFRFGASEYDLDEYLKASVDLVASLAEGRLRIIRRRCLFREREFLESRADILAPGWRIRSQNWWSRNGPYDRTFNQ